jgi:hypothetical protein
MHDISNETLQKIAGTIEALLIEQQEGIAFAYKRIPDGIKVSIGVNLDPISTGVCVSYTVSYPLQAAPVPAEKCTVKKQEMIGDSEPLFGSVTITAEGAKRALDGLEEHDKRYRMEGK